MIQTLNFSPHLCLLILRKINEFEREAEERGNGRERAADANWICNCKQKRRRDKTSFAQ